MRPLPQQRDDTPRVVHAPILGTRHWHWPDEAACAASAAHLAAHLAAQPAPADAFIALHGPLAAGKTTFVRHLLRALGVAGRVKSPTFTVLEPYRTPAGLEVSHFDFYRFDDPREWEDAGFRDVFARPGLKLAEWPDKAAPVLPPADLTLFIEPMEGARSVLVQARSARWLELLR
jgi:tRNA threonylcarbamoyladenosine biosynthesis protein TsaE